MDPTLSDGTDTVIPVDTSQMPTTTSSSWTPAQQLAAFNSALTVALTADAISHQSNLPTAYSSTIVPGAVAPKNNTFMLLLIAVGVYFFTKEA